MPIGLRREGTLVSSSRNRLLRYLVQSLDPPISKANDLLLTKESAAVTIQIGLKKYRITVEEIA